MKIGRIERGKRYVVLDLDRRAAVFNFTIGAERNSVLQLCHSSAATPARYVMEMARRLAGMPGANRVVIVNPLVEDSTFAFGLLINAVLAEGREDRAEVYADRAGLPIAYAFPAKVASMQSRFLSLLSTVDAAIDARLLEQVTARPTETRKLAISVRLATGRRESYSTPASRKVYRWTAVRAIEELERAAPGRQDEVPFAAIMPFHAGDVLFLATAFNRGQTHFRAAVIDRKYSDISREVAPDLALIETDLARRAAGGEAEWDWALSEAIQADLPRGYLYVYCRPTRQYDQYPVHLIDQYAFALGVALGGPTTAALPEAALRGAAKVQRKLLLHFDAGWAMKVYPEPLQQKLTEAAVAAGFEVTILSRKEESIREGVRFVRFRRLKDLRYLILNHGLVIGMDSFPAHYAANVLGVPTICLFSSTHPANSDVLQSVRYRAMQVGLECCPCGSVSRCPRFGGDSCRNFSDPAAVADAMVAMWRGCYGAHE